MLLDNQLPVEIETPPMRSLQMRPALVLMLIALALSACASQRAVEEPEAASTGPTVYGTISVSADHVSTR